MFIIKLADLNIKINSTNPYLLHLCNNYITNEEDFQIEISVSNDDIEFEKQYSEGNNNPNYLESVAVLRKIADEITNYDGFLLHSCIVKVKDFGYGFSAPSGTGKTTHSRLWQEYLKDDFCYINGDKPLIRIIDGIPYAYGTPWNGKEGFGTNTKAPLKALAFIKRDVNNYTIPLAKNTILKLIIRQVVLPNEIDKLDKAISSVNKMLEYTKIYEIHCNMELDAAIVAYQEMSKD